MDDSPVWLCKPRSRSRRRVLFKLAAGAALNLMIVACAAFPLVTVALPTATPLLNRPGEPTATFTPTPVIGAVEATPTLRAGGVLWDGIITSESERQYKHNGSTLDTCNTNWKAYFSVVVDPAGNVHGNGEIDLQDPLKCTPLPRSNNTEKIVLNLAGKADEKAFSLTINGSSVSPYPSADFGGIDSLFLAAVCKRELRTLTIPLISPDQANLETTFTADMTGCAGSAEDVMTSNDHIVLDRVGECGALPADVQNKPEAKLCGQ